MKLTVEQRFRISQIAARSPNGVLRVDDVLNDAMDPESPLHSLYEWDVEKAAMEHWRERTREIIQSVRVTVEVRETCVTAVAYVRDPELGGREQGYASTVSVSSVQRRSVMAIDAEFKRLLGLLERLRGIVQVFGLPTSVVDSLVAEVMRARERLTEIEEVE